MKVFVQFPGMNYCIFVPFHFFSTEVVTENVLSKYFFTNSLPRISSIASLRFAGRERILLLSLFLCQMEDVRVSRLSWINLAPYPSSPALHKGRKQDMGYRQGQTSHLLLSHCPGRRNTNQGAPILADQVINWCFISGYNSFIGVN